jgi:hypothetical protein
MTGRPRRATSYLVARDHYEEGDVHIGDSDPKAMADARSLVLEGGRIRERWPAEARLKHTPLEAIPLGALNKDAVANSFGYLFVNTRYKELLELRAPDAFEMLKIRLEVAPDSVVEEGWWVAHSVFRREAVDRTRSIWKPDAEEGKIRLFRKLVLASRVLKDAPVAFRLEEMQSVILFRSDLVSAIGDAKLTGLRFIPCEQFDSMRC